MLTAFSLARLRLASFDKTDYNGTRTVLVPLIRRYKMPIKRPILANSEIYHIVMRGTEGRVIFLEDADRVRFIHDLFEFNDEDAATSTFRKRLIQSNRTSNGTRTVLVPLQEERKKRKLLIEILAFCLMPNHFHLLLRQLKDNGISQFMRKLGGYATYINQKYNRQGHLYQGRFRAVHVEDEEQLKNGFVYIYTNPIELVEPGWKENGIENPKKAVEFLKNYRWSSFLDYIGKKNFPSVTNRDLLTEILGGPTDCQKFVEDWVLYKTEIKKLGNAVLE